MVGRNPKVVDVLFNLEVDTNDKIIAYVVPDAFSAPGEIDVLVPGREPQRVRANDMRPSVVAAGRHETGQCGFVLTADIVRDLPDLPQLELRETVCGLPVYRRAPPAPCPDLRLFRLETQSVRLHELDGLLAGLFTLAYPAIDRHGAETTNQTILLTGSQSLYISARLVYRLHEYSFDSGFRRLCLVQDPFVELAETLMCLSQEPGQSSEFGLREELGLTEIRPYFYRAALHDDAAVRGLLANLPNTAQAILSNPLCRLLGARNSEELPNLSQIASALEALSGFDIVGLRERPDTYAAALGELVGRPAATLAVSPPDAAVVQLADRLRTLPDAAALVDMDIDIYAAIVEVNSDE